MKKILPITFIGFCLFVFTIQSSAMMDGDDSWKLEKNKNGIKVYTRIANNFKFKEYRAVATINAPADTLVELIRDAENYPKWMTHVKNVRVLDRKSDNDLYVYTEVTVPWPFSNRDQVTRSELTKDNSTGAYHMTIELIPEYLPENKGIVRIKEGEGSWTFTPLSDNKTEVTQQFVANPGGNIPAWVVNMFIVDGPYKTFLNLKTIFKK